MLYHSNKRPRGRRVLPTLLMAWLAIAVSPSNAVAADVTAPVSVRPCCAFGINIKAQLGGVPIPFFRIGNTLNAEELGQHIYNDGRQSASASLLGTGKENNGLLYTLKAGFIDTAHVRDTADYSYFLYRQLRQKLGQDVTITLPAEIRARHIVLYPQSGRSLTDTQRQQLSLEIAPLLAFQLAQWHEISQWFGMTSVPGFPEFNSAFSPEDLYSNMLGANLAMTILSTQPELDLAGFSQAMDNALQATLSVLGVQTSEQTKAKISQLDGIWWDSSRRLPDKWALLQRQYQLSLQLSPFAMPDGHALQLTDILSNGDRATSWVQLQLHPLADENQFNDLPANWRQQAYWRVTDFQKLADFARQQDSQQAPDHVQR